MKGIIEAMALSPLFSGLELSELEELAVRFHLSLRTYEQGELVICQGEKAKGIGLVVSGRLHIVRDDFLGKSGNSNRSGEGAISLTRSSLF